MPFSVKAYYAARPLTVIAETAKEAFQKRSSGMSSKGSPTSLLATASKAIRLKVLHRPWRSRRLRTRSRPPPSWKAKQNESAAEC